MQSIYLSATTLQYLMQAHKRCCCFKRSGWRNSSWREPPEINTEKASLRDLWFGCFWMILWSTETTLHQTLPHMLGEYSSSPCLSPSWALHIITDWSSSRRYTSMPQTIISCLAPRWVICEVDEEDKTFITAKHISYTDHDVVFSWPVEDKQWAVAGKTQNHS